MCQECGLIDFHLKGARTVWPEMTEIRESTEERGGWWVLWIRHWCTSFNPSVSIVNILSFLSTLACKRVTSSCRAAMVSFSCWFCSLSTVAATSTEVVVVTVDSLDWSGCGGGGGSLRKESHNHTACRMRFFFIWLINWNGEKVHCMLALYGN